MEMVYILVTCRQGKFKLVSKSLRQHEEVDELHEVFGRYDLILKMVCKDRSEVQSFIQNKLQITEGIRTTETLVVSDLSSSEETAKKSWD